jgi:TM2 domain-containing membrane protein YozV
MACSKSPPPRGVRGATAASEDPPSKKKGYIMAYLWYACGGLFGTHHFYLGRDNQAHLWYCTGGGFLVGFAIDVFKIPRYVREANGERSYQTDKTVRLSGAGDTNEKPRPPWSYYRLFGAFSAR